MSVAERLIDMVSSRHRKHLVVIGDVMVDRWVCGHTAQSQDGCQKFVHEGSYDAPGGAGNAAFCLSGWGVSVELFGSRRPSTKTRFVDHSGKIVLRYDRDEVVGSDHDQDRKTAIEWVGSAYGVLLSDYDKGFLTREFIRDVANLCKRRSIPCVADVKRAPFVYEGCYTKGNMDWYERYGVASVITRGAEPPLVSDKVQMGVCLPTVKCVNHVGAGDCFAAHLVLGLAYGLSLEESAEVAHSAGRVYVQLLPNTVVRPSEIVTDMFVAAPIST